MNEAKTMELRGEIPMATAKRKKRRKKKVSRGVKNTPRGANISRTTLYIYVSTANGDWIKAEALRLGMPYSTYIDRLITADREQKSVKAEG